MSRRLKQTFNCQPLRDLSQQLLFSPPDKRERQVRRLEVLHDQLDPGKNYPLDFLYYRITGYRREATDAVLLTGAAVLPDLRLMIDALSRSISMPIDDPAGPCDTVEEFAKKLGISTKTVSRWRQEGLRWRWVVPQGGGRKVVAIPRDASQRFIADHPERVDRASRFTQIDPVTRRRLIERAARLRQRRPITLNQAAKHLASRTGRSLEAIRQLLAKHDREHPEQAIFSDHTGPLTYRQRKLIARAYRMGVSVEKLSARFGKSRPTIYRALHQVDAHGASKVALHYIASPTFDRDDAEQVILGKPITLPKPSIKTGRAILEDLPENIRPWFDQPTVPANDIRSWFVRFNFLRYQAARIRSGLNRYHPSARQIARFEEKLEQAGQLRDLLIRLHLPVVLSVARRHLIGGSGTHPNRLLTLLEVGLGVLIQAVETFNPFRQQRFDSFLTNRLLTRYAMEPQHPPGHARRRLDPDTAAARLRALAEEAGVELESDPSA